MTKHCPSLTFDAASKHTKPMPKSIVSPIRWLSIIQAYVLHCITRKEDVNHRSYIRTQEHLCSSAKSHVGVINLCTNTTEKEPHARFKLSQFPVHFLPFRRRPVSSPPPGKWPSGKLSPRSAAHTPAPRWRTCPPHSLSEHWSSASSCPEGHCPKISTARQSPEANY